MKKERLTMGENPTILCFGGVIGAGADAVPLADGSPVYFLKEEPKCEIVADPAAEPFTCDLPVRPNGFTMTATATVDKDAEETIASIARQLNESELTMEIMPSYRRLPRKMKKAFDAKYRRDTKWKRKVACWLKRNKIRLLGNFSDDGDGYTFTGKRIE